MNYSSSNNASIVDEIDRLSLTYEKSKEYLAKITAGIDQQLSTWQSRRQSFSNETNTTSDMFLPKAQRINELALEAAEALCRVELLVEQIIRIDPRINLTPSRLQHNSTSYDSFTPRSHNFSLENRNSFRPLGPTTQTNNGESSQRFSSFSRGSHQNNPYNRPFSFSRLQAPYNRQNSNESAIPPLMDPIISNYQQSAQVTQKKEKIRIQKIPCGTVWSFAQVKVVESLSKFTVQDYTPHVRQPFEQMIDSLNATYNDFETSHRLIPLKQISIGDFGVAKSSAEHRWLRARCIKCEGRDQIHVVFIDNGEIELKSMSEFFPIEQKFTSIAAQSVGCAVADVTPLNFDGNLLDWPKETIETFKRETLNKTVQIRFIAPDADFDDWSLHLVQILVNNQNLTVLPSLQCQVSQGENQSILNCLSSSLNEQDLIVFNVAITDDDPE